MLHSAPTCHLPYGHPWLSPSIRASSLGSSGAMGGVIARRNILGRLEVAVCRLSPWGQGEFSRAHDWYKDWSKHKQEGGENSNNRPRTRSKGAVTKHRGAVNRKAQEGHHKTFLPQRLHMMRLVWREADVVAQRRIHNCRIVGWWYCRWQHDHNRISQWFGKYSLSIRRQILLVGKLV